MEIILAFGHCSLMVASAASKAASVSSKAASATRISILILAID